MDSGWAGRRMVWRERVGTDNRLKNKKGSGLLPFFGIIRYHIELADMRLIRKGHLSAKRQGPV